MSFSHRFLALAAFLGLSLSAQSASATTVDFSDIHYNMGLVEVGDTGKIETYTRFYDDGFAYDYAKGKLPSMTQITFTYTFPASTGENGYVEGQVKYKEDGTRYWTGEATDNWSVNKIALKNEEYHRTTQNFDASVVTTMADDQKSATTVITNLSSAMANFKSFFFACNCFFSANVTTTYAVTAVPLPAALPLFGLGLVGLAGIKRFRKVG